MSGLRRQLPSANALFVFEAVARVGSFTKAAAELNVTQPAVSRMLARLEQHLGARLFDRTPSGIQLTDDGALLQRCVSTTFLEIEATITRIKARRTSAETVTLSLSTAFTTHWLMPRIHHFQRAFPNVDLRFQLISGSLRGSVEDVDLGMRFIGDSDSEHDTALFVPEEILPVCSPGYLKQHGPLAGGESDHTLLDLSESAPRWDAVLRRLDLGRDRAVNIMTFSDYAVDLQAAVFGQGIALGWNSVISYALRNGQLVPGDRRLIRTGRLCHLVASRAKPLRPVVVEIRDWLLAEMQADLKAIERRYPDLLTVEACEAGPHLRKRSRASASTRSSIEHSGTR